MLIAGTFVLLLWIDPPLELSGEEQVRVYEMAQGYKQSAHCGTGVLARVFLLSGEKKVLMECFDGEPV